MKSRKKVHRDTALTKQTSPLTIAGELSRNYKHHCKDWKVLTWNLQLIKIVNQGDAPHPAERCSGINRAVETHERMCRGKRKQEGTKRGVDRKGGWLYMKQGQSVSLSVWALCLITFLNYLFLCVISFSIPCLCVQQGLSASYWWELCVWADLVPAPRVTPGVWCQMLK